MRGRRVSLPRRPSAAARREQLILDHLRLVRPMAANIRARIPVHVELDDLVHDGICGLLDAARRYDSARNVPFAAYAKYRIRGSILDGLRRLDPASRDHRAKVRLAEAATGDLGNRLGRFPTVAEAAAETGISLQRWNRPDLAGATQPSARDRNEKTTVSRADLRADEASETDTLVARRELRNTLDVAMQSLPRRDQQIISLYHWRGCTMREIGRFFDINESRVSQIHKRALERLAATLRGAALSPPRVEPARDRLARPCWQAASMRVSPYPLPARSHRRKSMGRARSSRTKGCGDSALLPAKPSRLP